MLITPRFGAALRARHPGRAHARHALMAILASLAVLLVPRSAAAQAAADSSVTLLWTATGDDGTTGTATSYDLRYRTVGIAGTDTSSWWSAATRVGSMPAPRAAGSTDSVRVQGLTPLTTYYFLIRVGDEVPNWSGYSNLAVRTTGSTDVTAPATIADLTITGSTGTSMSIRWTAPGDDGATGTATSYDIRYSNSAITGGASWGSATQATGEPAPAAAGTQQTFTITGLTPGRTYYAVIRAIDEAGNISGLSNVPSGSTLDTVAPAPVRDLSLDPDSGVIDPLVAAAAGIEVATDAC